MADFNQFRSVTKAEAAAASAAPAPEPLAASPAADAASSGAVLPKTAPSPPARIVGGPARSMTVPLVYPVEHEGRRYEAITVRRPTSVEVGRFFERLIEEASTDPDALVFFPVFYDADDRPIPPPVIVALDDDDRGDVMGRVEDFLPRRLLALRAGRDRASGPASGANTAPTSST